jgi:hypothetical protein
MMLDENERALYYYAISCALAALVGYAGRAGRGWYHFAGGDLIVVTEVAL